nr:C. briggsae CBR-NPP-6 protein [Haemonchus contortus]
MYDTEVVFTESFAAKPVRTLVVNTNAPLHSINTNIDPSSGVCTFPSDSQFPDRFILWRAIGQKLFLEERSLCRTIVDGTMCLDFSRTPILPGTSIALFDQNVLCIVVPTQSTVHRFYARLIYDPTEMINREVPSIFTQIIEKEFLVDNHTLYQLTTNGHAFRSSVIHQPDLSRIAYCMTEGQLVVVTMYANMYDKVEEVTFREYGFMKRLLGEASSSGVADVSGLDKEEGDSSSSENMFYAVYRDGTLRAWNAETQRVHYIDVCKLDSTTGVDQECLRSLRVKAYQIESAVVLVVAIATSKNTKFHFLSDQRGKIAHLFTVDSDNGETLLDFGLLYKNAGCRSLWALWNSMSTTNEYFVEHIDIEISPSHRGTWRKVNTSSLPDPISDTMTVLELKESVFNMDSHPFDIVSRSVQIACKGTRCEYKHGDWAALMSHVDSYLRSPEFDSIYTQRGSRTLKSSSSDSQSDAEHRFFMSLARTCDQLEVASRGPLGLFLLDMTGAVLTGVIQQDRFSVILSGESKLIDEMESDTSGDMKKILTVAIDRAAAKEEDGMVADENEIINGPAHRCKTMRAELIAKKWSSIMDIFLKDVICSDPSRSPTFTEATNMFNGSFVCGLISSTLRHVVHQRLKIAKNLLAVIQLYEAGIARFEYHFFDIPNLEDELGEFISLYSLFNTQLSLRLSRDNAQASLCSWFMAGDGVDLICETAQIGDPDENSSLPHFNEFLSSVVKASLQILSPKSTHALLARSLANHDRYLALMQLCNTYETYKSEDLRPVVTFYKAIAFSGLGKPLKAMAAFNAAARGVTDCNEALLLALSSFEKKAEEINLGDYYVVALRYLNNHRHSEEVIEMARSAIALLPPGHKCTSTIYATLFNHLINQGNWCDALLSIIQNTDPEVKRMALGELIKRMLHANDWQSIVDLNYGKLEDEVERTLLTSARAQEATVPHHLFKLVFSFYMKRNDFEGAARAQYEYAFVLRTQAEQTPELLRKRRDALAVASTLLDLLPENDRFISFPSEFQLPKEPEEESEPESPHEITQEMIDVTLRDVIADELNMAAPSAASIQRRMFILTAEKLCEECVIANARVALLVTGEVPPCDPKEIVDKLIAIKNYDVAFDVCRHCDVSVCDLLCAVTLDSLSIDANPPDILPSWVQANQRRSEKIGPSNHWSVVRGLLAAAERLWPNDSRPLRAITRTFLAHGIPVPCWLDAEYAERDVGGYLRCLIEYGAISQGLNVAANCVDQETKKVKSTDSSVWLPLTAISDLISLGAKQKEDKLLSCLNEKLRTHFMRVEGFEKVAQLSH